MTSKKLAFAMLVASCVGTSSLTSNAAPAAKPQAQAQPGAIDKLKVELDTTGIAKTVKVEIAKKEPYEGEEEVIYLNGAPRHIRILFDGKKMQYGDNDFMEPHLLVYPLADYVAMFPKKKQVEFNKRIATLRKILASKSVKGVDEIPILPESDGAEFLHQQIKYLNFKNGTGISYVSAYGNGDPVLEDKDFFYTYQGITSDGKHYVSFFWPVKATGMKKNLNPTDIKKYVEKLPRANFSPSLDALDNLSSSISIK